MKLIAYIMVASSLIAADLISINIKFMELSLFRISILLLSFYTFLYYFKTEKKINIYIKNKHDLILKFYFFWFMYSLFTIGWVSDYYSWIRAIFFIGCGTLSIWILSVYIREEKEFKKVFTAYFAMIVIHNIIGWHELITGTYQFAELSRIDKYGQFGYNSTARIPISMFGNINDYATVLTIGVFLIYIIFLNTKKKTVKLLCIGNILSSAYLIIRTKSRANMLGLIIGIIIFVYLKYFRKISIKTFLAMIATPIILFNPIVVNRMISVLSKELQFNFSGKSGSDVVRLGLIKNGLLFLKDTAGFGVGAGNIEYWMETKKVFFSGNITNMHNWWMEILVGYGIIIFIGYIWMYFIMAKVLYNSYLKSDDRFIKSTSLGLLSIMGAFVISSISSSSNVSSQWLWLFWGVVIAYVGYVEKESVNYTNQEYIK